MKKTIAAEQAHIILDICGKGDGIWLDGGEIVHLVNFLASKSAGKSSDRVLNFIKETFKAEVLEDVDG